VSDGGMRSCTPTMANMERETRSPRGDEHQCWRGESLDMHAMLRARGLLDTRCCSRALCFGVKDVVAAKMSPGSALICVKRR